MSNFLPPPPPSLLADRELYLWLTQVYRLLNGTDSGFVMSMDSASSIANAAASRAATAEQIAEDAVILSAPAVVAELDAMRGELMAVRAQNAELKKQVESMALLMQSRVVDVDAIVRDAVLLAGGGQ